MVVVFGSINLDLVCRVAHFPSPGETVSGSSFSMFPGGKGANQALAAARAGAGSTPVRMFGAIGNDVFASAATTTLIAGGVDIAGVATVDLPTGCATVLVDDQGENCIVVVAGANAKADPSAIPDAMLTSTTVAVLQQEVDLAANASLIARAHHAGACVMLNAAPAHAVPLDLLRKIDILVVNEAEASTLARGLGFRTPPLEFALSATAEVPGLAVALTLGAVGALWVAAGTAVRVAAPVVRVVDTTGAGDAFVGALAAALDTGARPVDAMRRAVAAGSLACTLHGAQPALPDRATIDALLPSVTAFEN
jgi:ribokinase